MVQIFCCGVVDRVDVRIMLPPTLSEANSSSMPEPVSSAEDSPPSELLLPESSLVSPPSDELLPASSSIGPLLVVSLLLVSPPSELLLPASSLIWSLSSAYLSSSKSSSDSSSPYLSSWSASALWSSAPALPPVLPLELPPVLSLELPSVYR